MSYCTKCGVELSEGVNFCTSCGAKIGTHPPSTPAFARKDDKGNLDKINIEIEETRHSERMAYWGILAGLILFVVAVWLGFGFTETRTEWHGILPYEVKYHPYSIPAALCMIGGIVSIIISSIQIQRYSNKRKHLMEN